MKLSNTMIMNGTLLPNTKKAFTLAEVLITLSILGVVAALTIPSLVNRQSDMAAIVKMKKAVSQYEQVAEVFMAENDATSFKNGNTAWDCAALKNYFKFVDNGVSNAPSGACEFKTADGAIWVITGDGNAVVYDSASPKIGVVMWARNGVVNGTGTNAAGQNVVPSVEAVPADSGSGKPILKAPTKGYYSAADLLKINKGTELTDSRAMSAAYTKANK